MAETEINMESLKKIQVVLQLEPKLPTGEAETNVQPVEEMRRDIIEANDISVVRKIDEGKTCIFDRPDVVIRKTIIQDNDLSKPSTSRQFVREEDDEFEATINSWVDSSIQKPNSSLFRSLQKTMKLLKSQQSFSNNSRCSKKRNRSRSSSNERYNKKYRSSYYSDKKNDLNKSSHDTASSISSDESISDHGYHSKKTNEYKYDRRRSSTPLSSSMKKHRSRRSRRASNSKKSNRYSRDTSKYDENYEELYEQYRSNKMYMKCLQMNIGMQAIQALLEIITSMNSTQL